MTLYDEVPYPTHAFTQTHPDRLSTLARLYGMTPADPRRCRVLELGCGGGGNLIPMAEQLPESEFLGVDLAARPVAEGQELIEETGLRNVTLRQQDIMEFPEDAGLFDYVIAHGVYSWVPAEVRDRLLAVARAHLAPQGVAFVSYNAFPGGHTRNMLREMMLFHVREIEDPQRRIAQARAMLKFLADAQTGDDHYSLLLRRELKRVIDFPPEHLYHDDLADINEHFYFMQFAQHAASHGLKFVCEGDFHSTHHRWRAADDPDPLAELDGDPLLREQYGDFVVCRRFRQTLLCHDAVALERRQRPEQMRDFYFAAHVNPAPPEKDARPGAHDGPRDEPHGEPRDDLHDGLRDNPRAELHDGAGSDDGARAGLRADARTDTKRRYLGMNGITLNVGFPLAKAAFVRLGELWPRAASFDELLDDARSILGRGGDDDSRNEGGDDAEERARAREEDAADLCRVLLTAYAGGFLEAHSYSSPFAAEASERPRTTAVARAQARRGTHVANLRHVNLLIEDELGRRLIQLLDGTRDRAALLEELRLFVESGEALGLEGEDADPQGVLRSLPEQLEANLKRLASYALFAG